MERRVIVIHLRYLERAGRNGVRDSDDSVPLDDADLHQGAGLIGADEHRHRIVLHEMSDREAERMKHRLIRNAVPVGTIQDDRLRLHSTRLLATRELAKPVACDDVQASVD